MKMRISSFHLSFLSFSVRGKGDRGRQAGGYRCLTPNSHQGIRPDIVGYRDLRLNRTRKGRRYPREESVSKKGSGSPPEA